MQPLSRRVLSLQQRPASMVGVCRSCRRRLATTASSAAPPKPPASGLAELSSRRVLAVAGADATKFLQGIVTQNVATVGGHGRNQQTTTPAPPRTEGFYAGFLNATGRVMHDTFIYPFRSGAGGLAALESGDGFLVEADAAQATRLEKYIKRYKLRAKVSVRSLAPDEVSVWQAWDDAAAAADGAALSLPSSTATMTLRDPRAPAMGYRLLQLGGGAPGVDAERADEDAYTIRRYLQGVPEGQDELLREHALPLESNMEHMCGIDFHKGCYVGQELTIRTKHRGVVRKRVLPCVLYDVDRPAPATLAYDPEGLASLSAAAVPGETGIGRFEKRGRSAGKWLKGVGNIGLALCRLEIMTDVVLPGEQAAATYNPEDEFVLEWGGQEDVKSSVKIKAFVPDWLRAGMEEGLKK
ncbi:aminomethyl transferase [Akanthomyces lecanii RCEF 1005]|uniref:Iron-sulfur cluster assembly factor IBA57 homolog, mitochondrial n=1 Tax=Akanthomyces lecanii RCEF 1005 TaxID=1081108 RepID=A0A168HFL1_CORDF|nr:aminomethyl transferase [Akanthomyces lecanii RCEF 1005]